MHIRLLGPVEARLDDQPIALGGAKQRAVLAMLGLEANRAVTVERLIEGLWGGQPPPSAGKVVQTYVWRLRKVLDGVPIVTRGRAYELRIDRELVDVLRLERLVAEARRAANGDTARQALALFRGAPLADVAHQPFADAEIRRLEELRLAAAELAIDSDLASGRHGDVIAEVDALLAENPLRERLHAQRMLALYRSGRQAEALEAFRDARATLVEEVGIEPGAEMQRLHAAILRQERALDVEPARSELAHELDIATPMFGRDAELARLRDRQRGGGLVTIAGPYGMGKTRLAAELARERHREGATVLYASGMGAPEAALAAIGRAAAAPGQALLVLEDADRAPVEVRRALRELRHGRAFVLATGLQEAALLRLEPEESIVLAPLDAAAVRSIARLYAPARVEIPVSALLVASRGVARRAHQAAREWARRQATQRVESLTARSAAGRTEARALEDELAESVVDLQRLDRLEGDRPEALVVCPYKGLAPFDRDDADYFFGREELVAELVARVVGAQLLAVVGPSGSGKSSVVRAGLLPALGGGVLRRSESWAQAVIRPGAHPVRELRRAARKLAPHERGVLVVDQFEELFTACADGPEREEFASRLVRLPRCHVVAVIRADFYGRCSTYPALSRALGANHLLVGPMSREELRSAIERPAQRVGLTVEPDLVEALLADLEGQAGALPLLSTALRELWGQRQGRRLELAAYARSGGVQGAVARLAEEAYLALERDQQATARALLLRLADEDENGTIVSRRIQLDGQDADVVAWLTEHRLLTVSDGTVQVAHEALLREWPRLRGWLDEDAQGQRLHRALTDAARAWDRDARDPGGLYRGARLASALDWAAGHHGALDATEQAFLEAARRASGRAQRRMRLVLAGVIASAVVAGIAGAVAIEQRDRARQQLTAASAQQLGSEALAPGDVDRALLLARQGVAIDDSMPTRSNLLATLLKSPAAIGIVRVGDGRLSAIELDPSGRTLAVADDNGFLHLIDAQSRRRLRSPQLIPGGGPGPSLAFDASGSRLAIGGTQPVVLDARTRRTIAQLRTSGHAVDLRFSRDGRTVFGILARGPELLAVQRFDARTGAALIRPRTIGHGWGSVLVARDGRRIVTSVENGPIVVRDARTLKPLRTLGVRATAVALSPDGRTLLAGGRDGSVRFVEISSGSVRAADARHDGVVARVAFSRDGRSAASGGADRRAQVWDVASGALREPLVGHTAPVHGLTFSRDARTLYSAADDGKVLIWDLAGDRRFGRPFAIRPYASRRPENAYVLLAPTSYALNSDGRTLAIGHDDGTVSLTDVHTLRRGRSFRALHRRPVASLGYMPDGRLLVSDPLGSAVMLDPRTGSVGRAQDDLGTPVAPSFSRNGRLMASIGAHGSVAVRTLRSGRLSGRPRLVDTAGAVSVSLSPDGRTLAVASLGDVEIVDVATRRRRSLLGGTGAVPTAVQFSRDGRLLAAGGLGGWIRVWSAQTWRPLARVQTQTGGVYRLAISPDGAMLAAGGDGGAIELIDLNSGQPFGTPLPGVANQMAAPLFTPDGYLLSITDAGRAYRWDMRPTAWVRHACAVAGRRLTRVEWAEVLPDRDYSPAC